MQDPIALTNGKRLNCIANRISNETSQKKRTRRVMMAPKILQKLWREIAITRYYPISGQYLCGRLFLLVWSWLVWCAHFYDLHLVPKEYDREQLKAQQTARIWPTSIWALTTDNSPFHFITETFNTIDWRLFPSGVESKVYYRIKNHNSPYKEINGKPTHRNHSKSSQVPYQKNL